MSAIPSPEASGAYRLVIADDLLELLDAVREFVDNGADLNHDAGVRMILAYNRFCPNPEPSR